ncbi:MAG: ATP-binding cassette domain-containing protein, partial [Desulfobacterales bacterium]|nr:ATP-binding cassette domain-containing protein [Desulfobacterales bacterium]
MKIRNARSDQIFIPSFHVKPGQSWCVIGANRSGIRAFFDLVCGNTEKVTADTLELSGSTGWVSFKDQQQIYEQELKNDDTDYLDRPDPGTLGRDFLTNADAHLELIEAFGMTACLNKGYRRMSTGQTRKLLILGQITKGNSTLIIQAPFEGLDTRSRSEVNRALEHLHTQQVNLLLFVHNPEDIPSWCSHLALVSDGQLAIQGPLSSVRQEIESRMVQAVPDFNVSAVDLFKREMLSPVNGSGPGRSEPPEDGSGGVSGAAEKADPPEELVHLENGTAGYDGTPVFNGVSLQIRRGDHTLVTGPNGCGKSTLLHMITGDHPACYQNNLRIF